MCRTSIFIWHIVSWQPYFDVSSVRLRFFVALLAFFPGFANTFLLLCWCLCWYFIVVLLAFYCCLAYILLYSFAGILLCLYWYFILSLLVFYCGFGGYFIKVLLVFYWTLRVFYCGFRLVYFIVDHIVILTGILMWLHWYFILFFVGILLWFWLVF